MTTKGIVLMLHGWAQNAKVMEIKTKNITRKLQRAGYNCIFLEAPHILPMTSTINNEGISAEIDNGRRKNARAWFMYSETDPADASLSQSGEPMSYFGLDESLQVIRDELLKQQQREHDSFISLFGFSQGAVFAHLLAQLRKDPPFDNIKAFILASGFPSQHDVYHDSNKMIDIPSLHVIGRKDTSVQPALSLELTSKFQSAEIMYHDKGHIVAQQSGHCAHVVGFLDKALLSRESNK